MTFTAKGKYVVGTGYYREDQRAEDFLCKRWIPNTMYAEPERILITNAASPLPPALSPNWCIQWLNLATNPRHGRRLKEPVKFAGWSLGFIHGALYAYSCGYDYIYKEQDCLAFGDWVERIYAKQRETGCGILTGKLANFPKRELSLEMCLTFVAYDYIMPLLTALFSIALTEKDIWPEGKFVMIRDEDPGVFATLDFGYGGNRPFDAAVDCFYIQKPRWRTDTEEVIVTPVGSGIPDHELKRLPRP